MWGIEALMAMKRNDLTEFKRTVTVNNVYKRDKSGYAILHHACDEYYNSNDNPDFVEYLVMNLKGDVDVLSTLGRTALHYALRIYPLPRCAQKLLQLGADTGIKDQVGQTPLMFVLCNCVNDKQKLETKKTLVWLLLEYGSEYNVVARVLPWVNRMKSGRKNARVAAISFLGIQRYRLSKLFGFIGKDGATCVAKEIWKSRMHYEHWFCESD